MQDELAVEQAEDASEDVLDLLGGEDDDEHLVQGHDVLLDLLEVLTLLLAGDRGGMLLGSEE